MSEQRQDWTGRTEMEDGIGGVHRRSVLKAAGVGAFVGLAGVPTASATPTSTMGGPVALLGIDAEEFAYLGSHGGIGAYIPLVQDLLSKTTNGGSGILVVRGPITTDGNNVDHVEAFWNTIGSNVAESITYVSGAAVGSATFGDYKLLAVTSSKGETFYGGITDIENAELIARSADIAAHVNTGGGLLGLSQDGLTSPWEYLGDVGAFVTNNPPQYDDITATPAGNAVGITDLNLDVCCWHDTFLTYPSFLDVLATHNDPRYPTNNGEVAALGGAQVIIGQLSETYDLCGGQDIPVGTATVAETNDGYGVTFEMTDGWMLTETHIDVGDEFDDFHTAGRNNPQVGKFDYSETHDKVTSYTEVIDADDPELDDVDSECLLFAIHAVVVKEVAPDEYVSETAWVCPESEAAIPFNSDGGGNWATYVEFGDCNE